MDQLQLFSEHECHIWIDGFIIGALNTLADAGSYIYCYSYSYRCSYSYICQWFYFMQILLHADNL